MPWLFDILGVALATVTIASSVQHTCIHDNMHAAFPPLPAGKRHVQTTEQTYERPTALEDDQHRKLQSSYSPIRITLDTSLLAVNACVASLVESLGFLAQPLALPQGASIRMLHCGAKLSTYSRIRLQR